MDDLGLRGAAVTGFSWSEPSDPGGHPPRYDLLRSDDPADFSSPTFVLMGGAGRTASDHELPAGAFFYQVRARNGCGSGGAPAVSPWEPDRALAMAAPPVR